MLREEVLRSWNSCKEKVLISQKRTLTAEEMFFLESLEDITASLPISKATISDIKDLETKVSRIKRDWRKFYLTHSKLIDKEDVEDESIFLHIQMIHLNLSSVATFTYQDFLKELQIPKFLK